MRLTRRYFLLSFGLFAFVAFAHGVTLDWQDGNSAPPQITSPDKVEPGDAHDVPFATVPEINPGWSAVGSCLVAAALILRHSAKFRK